MRPGVRLGVDVGSARVGLAVSDRDGRLALPVASLPRGAGDIEAIRAEAVERDVLEVVVGLPIRMSGDEGPAAVAARAYAMQLRDAVGVPVRLMDERLSTVSAHGALREAGVRGTAGRVRTRDVVDASAAAVILQAALDAEVQTGTPPGEIVGPADD